MFTCVIIIVIFCVAFSLEAATAALAPPSQEHVLIFGGSQIAIAPLATPLNLGSRFTMEAWVYLESVSPFGVIMGKAHDSRGSDPFVIYNLDFDNERLEFVQTTGQPGTWRAAIAPTAFPLRVWTHVAATLDSGIMRLYINGQEVASQTSPGTPVNGAAPFAIGSSATPDGKIACCALNGALRQVRVWNRALSAAELTDNAVRILNGNETGLVTYWPLDDGEGRLSETGDRTICLYSEVLVRRKRLMTQSGSKRAHWTTVLTSGLKNFRGRGVGSAG